MMAGIESRFLFLDEELVRFAINLPLKWKIRQVLLFYNFKHPFLMDKVIVRIAGQRILSKEIVYRKK